MKKEVIIIGLIAGLTGAMVSMGATKQVIRLDETASSGAVSESAENAGIVDGGTESISKVDESGESANIVDESMESVGITDKGVGSVSENAPEESMGENGLAGQEPYKMWGQVLEVGEGGFSFGRQFPEGGSEEVIVHIDPERTLLLDVDGYPVGQDAIKKGDTVYVYPGPAMTLSLPAQATADMVIVGIRQDDGVPEYVMAAGPLADNGQGGYLFTTPGGREFTVPADCMIIPYLTRQKVELSNIGSGSRCLLWFGEKENVEKIVLFND